MDCTFWINRAWKVETTKIQNTEIQRTKNKRTENRQKVENTKYKLVRKMYQGDFPLAFPGTIFNLELIKSLNVVKA